MPPPDPTPLLELFEAALEHPVFRLALTATILASLAAFLVGLPALVAAWRRGDLRFDIVPALALKPADVLGFSLLLVLILSVPPLTPLFIPISLLGVLWLLYSNGISPVDQFGLRRFSLLRAASLGLWICLGMLALIFPLGQLVESVLRALGQEPAPQQPIQEFFHTRNSRQLVSLTLLAVVIAPVVEEVLFRGFLQPVLKRRMPPALALLLTAALFAYIHFHAASFVQLWLLGLALGLAYESSGSLTVSIFLHAWFNAIQTSLILLVRLFGGPSPACLS